MELSKSKRTPKTAENHAVIFGPEATDVDKAQADFWLHPATAAAAVIEPYSRPAMTEVNSDALAQNLKASMDEATYKGDSLAMLRGQAAALQAIFVELSRKALNASLLNQYETHLKLALRAQNQCRMTLETLSNIQNPPVVYARQANINNGGQQQVNNGQASDLTPTRAQYAQAPVHAADSENTPNKLLEASHGERLDFGAQAA